METRLQTKVTDQNRFDFFKAVYPQLNKPKNHLIQLNKYNVSSYVLADCCGWYYKTLWPDLIIFGLETLNSIKEYKLEKSKFQGIIDSRDYSNIKWPNINTSDCALIFDHSVILKYRTVEDIVNIITTASEKYQPKVIVFNSLTMFIDDSRFGDRFVNLSKILIPGFVVTAVSYQETNLTMEFKRKVAV